MKEDLGASPDGDRATAAEPVVSALRDGVPSAAHVQCDLCDAVMSFGGSDGVDDDDAMRGVFVELMAQMAGWKLTPLGIWLCPRCLVRDD